MSGQITFAVQGLAYLLPELILAGALLLLVITDMAGGRRLSGLSFLIALLAVLGSALVLQIQPPAQNPLLFNALFPNAGTVFFRLLADISILFILLFWKYSRKNDSEEQHSEYPVFWISLLFAAHILIVANHWLMVYLSIEMISISSYILIGFGLGKRNVEAAFKYLVFGALSSGIMLFGISLILATDGNLNFSGYAFDTADLLERADLRSIGMMMAFAGVFFKISLFPFHFWVPDAYQGTSLPVMNMLALLPKIAAFGFFTAQFLLIWPEESFASSQFSDFIAIMAIISLIWGNFSALAQKNFARLFAYSGIAQSGFLLFALLNGYEGILNLEIYLSLYVFMNLLVFVSADLLTAGDKSLEIPDFNGLGKKHVFFGISITMAMLALIGLPPTGGFTAKFVILTGMFEWYSVNSNLLRLALFILAVVNVAVSLFYYLKLPYAMFFKASDARISNSVPHYIIITISFVILIAAFIFFTRFREMIQYLTGDMML